METAGPRYDDNCSICVSLCTTALNKLLFCLVEQLIRILGSRENGFSVRCFRPSKAERGASYVSPEMKSPDLVCRIVYYEAVGFQWLARNFVAGSKQNTKQKHRGRRLVEKCESPLQL